MPLGLDEYIVLDEDNRPCVVKVTDKNDLLVTKSYLKFEDNNWVEQLNFYICSSESTEDTLIYKRSSKAVTDGYSRRYSMGNLDKYPIAKAEKDPITGSTMSCLYVLEVKKENGPDLLNNDKAD